MGGTGLRAETNGTGGHVETPGLHAVDVEDSTVINGVRYLKRG